MIPGITWVTGDAVHMAASDRLWPHVTPRLPEVEAAIVVAIEYIGDAYADFHWMGEDVANPADPAEVRGARLRAIGTGTLKDPMIRKKCVCPMTDCVYVLRAYTYRVDPPRIQLRIPRPRAAMETRDATDAREALNRADGGELQLHFETGAIRYVDNARDCIPTGRALEELIRLDMNNHINSTHKSDPASDRAKVPQKVRPKLEASASKAQVELFEQE